MVNDRQPEELQDWERQALLTEYQVCQRDRQSQSSTYWTIVGIFLSITTALAGGFLFSILKGDLSLDSNARWVILGFSAVAIAIIILLILWLKRTDYFITIDNQRMCEIEDTLTLKMHLNRVTHYLDEPEDKWPDKLKDIIKKYIKHKKCYIFKGKIIVTALFVLVTLPWVFLIIIASCPSIIECILRN